MNVNLQYLMTRYNAYGLCFVQIWYQQRKLFSLLLLHQQTWKKYLTPLTKEGSMELKQHLKILEIALSQNIIENVLSICSKSHICTCTAII